MTRALVSGIGLLALAGCGAPFGPCYSELVIVSVDGTVDRGTGPDASAAAGQVAPGNVSDFPILRGFFIDGEAVAGSVVVFTATGLGAGFVAVGIPGSIGAGQRVPLSAFQGGGWGTLTSGSGGLLAWRDGDFEATSVSGTLTVLEREPLRLRLDFTAGAASGQSRTVDVTASFRYERTRVGCD
ncbi:MAG: hypothetical protein AB7R55_07715 [Gemmatimonadales bacterium]